MIRSRNLDAEAGRWSEPTKLAASGTAAFSWKNPTKNEVYVDKVLINVTTAAASKTVDVGVHTSATGSSSNNELADNADLTSTLTTIIEEGTTVAKGSYVVGTLSAEDTTLVAYVYVHYKELTF